MFLDEDREHYYSCLENYDDLCVCRGGVCPRGPPIPYTQKVHTGKCINLKRKELGLAIARAYSYIYKDNPDKHSVQHADHFRTVWFGAVAAAVPPAFWKNRPWECSAGTCTDNRLHVTPRAVTDATFASWTGSQHRRQHWLDDKDDATTEYRYAAIVDGLEFVVFGPEKVQVVQKKPFMMEVT